MGRPKLGFKMVSAMFPPKLIEQLANIRKHLGITASQVMRDATQERADELEKQFKKEE